MKAVWDFFNEKVVGNIWFIALFIAPVLVLIAYAVASVGVFGNIENRLLDSKFKARGVDTALKKNSQVVIISIDDQAQEVVGQSWPWPRDYCARLVRNLARAGAKAVAFDFVFDADSKIGGDEAFKKAITKYGHVVLAGRPKTSFTEEKRIEYTSGQDTTFQNGFTGTPGSTVGLVFVRNDADGVYRRYHPASQYFGKQIPAFGYAILQSALDASGGSGKRDSLTVLPDGRTFEFAGKTFPSYDGESVLLNYYGPSKTFPVISAEAIMDDHEFFTAPEREKFNEAMRQTGLDSAALLKDESLADLWIEDMFDDTLTFGDNVPVQQQVAGKICIIGPMFPESKDLFPTPIDAGRADENQMYGVEIHATAVQNFLDDKFITPVRGISVLLSMLGISYLMFGLAVSLKRLKIPNYSVLLGLTSLASLVVFTAFGLLLLFLFLGESPLPYLAEQSVSFHLIMTLVCLGFAALITLSLNRANSMIEFVTEVGAILLAFGVFIAVLTVSESFFVQRQLVPVVPFAVVVALTYAATVIYQYLTESQQKKVIRGFFNAYVNPEVVDQLISNPSFARLGGEKRELTMLFSDIKGFTKFSEALEPEDLVILLNEYLGAMTEIVLKTGGTLDKYVGDAVVAFWNAPIPMPDHAKRAAEAAIQMQEKLVELREKWKGEGKPEVLTRIGLNTGKVIVGNMGSQARFSYTAMGDAMNLASRLEGANKAFGTYILISEFTQKIIEPYFQTREMATITVQGKEQPITVYELVSRKEPGKHYEPLEPAETAKHGVMAIEK